MIEERRYFTFNTIYIIESLPIKDRQTGQELYNDIVRYIPDKISILKTNFQQINNKEELRCFFEDLNREASIGNRPYLHFEIHGSKEGFVLNSSELVSWREVADSLRILNVIAGNNIMISLATCYGAYIYGNILPTQPSPFYGFIGPWEKITEDEIMVSFTQFFESIMGAEDIRNIDLDAAVDKLNEFNTMKKFVLCVSEAVFNRVMKEHENSLLNPSGLKRRVQEAFKRALQNEVIRGAFSRKQLKREIERQYIIREPKRAELKMQFLMQNR